MTADRRQAEEKKMQELKTSSRLALFRVDLNTATSTTGGAEVSNVLEHSDKPGTPNLYVYNCLNLNVEIDICFSFFFLFQLVGSTC